MLTYFQATTLRRNEQPGIIKPAVERNSFRYSRSKNGMNSVLLSRLLIIEVPRYNYKQARSASVK
jgi:hypothetical protein